MRWVRTAPGNTVSLSCMHASLDGLRMYAACLLLYAHTAPVIGGAIDLQLPLLLTFPGRNELLYSIAVLVSSFII